MFRSGSSPTTLAEVLVNLQEHPDERKIMLENNQEIKYNVDAKKEASAKLGTLEIIDKYELKYLLVHATCVGEFQIVGSYKRN